MIWFIIINLNKFQCRKNGEPNKKSRRMIPKSTSILAQSVPLRQKTTRWTCMKKYKKRNSTSKLNIKPKTWIESLNLTLSSKTSKKLTRFSNTNEKPQYPFIFLFLYLIICLFTQYSNLSVLLLIFVYTTTAVIEISRRLRNEE